MTRSASASVELEAVACSSTAAELGESPLWDTDAGLRWVDVPSRRLVTLAADGWESVVDLPCTVTAIELSTSGRLLAVTSTGFGWLEPSTGAVTEIVRVLTDESVTMNDGAIDPRGRCWAGSAVRDGSRRGCLYRLEGRQVSTHLEQLGMSNGIDWSPAGETLYHVDTDAGTLTAWAYEPATGELGEGRVLRTIPPGVGLPDGLTVDTAGDIWLAIWGLGQVWRLNPVGATTAVVRVPAKNPTSCVFGGRDHSTLYITSAADDTPNGGLTYRVDVPATGQPPRRFAGDRP